MSCGWLLSWRHVTFSNPKKMAEKESSNLDCNGLSRNVWLVKVGLVEFAVLSAYLSICSSIRLLDYSEILESQHTVR